MKSKHKELDKFCSQHYNPALFEDLMVDGKWWFNLLVVEMTNMWFGGFHFIVCKIHKDRYDFFLDEMIRWHNMMIVDGLHARSVSCYQILSSYLLA